MKLTIPTFFFGLMSLSAATTYSENKKLTLDLEGVILIDVFKQIESQTCSDLISTGYESPRSNIMSNADIVNEITSNSIAEAFIYPNPAFD